MRFKKSFIQTLIQKRLIFNYKIVFRDKYKGLNAINFNFLLTEHGLRNLDLIIQLLNRYIQLIHKHINNKEFYDKVKEKINDAYMKKKPIDRAYKDMKTMTKNFYLYGKDNIFTSNNLLGDFNYKVLHDYIKNMTIDNSIIYVSSRNFKYFNKTHTYKILNDDNDNNKNIDFNDTSFLDKKEKWYKTKYATYKLDEDKITHLFRRKLSTEITYPSFNNKNNIVLDTNLCDKNIKKKDVSSFYYLIISNL